MKRRATDENKFCRLSDLTNEAAVEQYFASRLFTDLGYRDGQIKPKTTLDELTVNLGRKKLLYRPDYAIVVAKKVRWIADAKRPSESLDDWTGQCASYCLQLNRREPDKPVEFFLLTNGVTTSLYRWDEEKPLLTLAFADFRDDSRGYQRLCEMLAPGRFARRSVAEPIAKPQLHALVRRSIEEVNADFAWCHQFIHKKDALSQAASFIEFVKIVFLKLLSDREVRASHSEQGAAPTLEIPAGEVRFSTRWLDEREKDHPNPLDALQFQDLVRQLEAEIKNGTRKRIFDADAHIDLSPDTIRGVVGRLEHTDLYSIDADLNGRLFETFLSATMRGKDLGQYFTPRSVVKLAVRLAGLRADREHIDTVLDACCGSGGFLIDALAELWQKIDANASLNSRERDRLKRTVAIQKIVGVDIAKDPPLARIARMNMFLHGDGGTRIFQADALNKDIPTERHDRPEITAEKRELRELISGGGFADVVLTNPPFAKEYSRREREGPLLDRYEMAFATDGGRRKPRQSLRSSVMFLERYCDLLKPGGRIITVIDDSILGGRDYRQVRDFLRNKFIVRAVVSLPGDAFQRSNARVKTSLLYLVKRTPETEQQPRIFMAYCTVVGLDDPARQRVLPVDKRNREGARAEIARIGSLFDAFMAGDRSAAAWSVGPEAIVDRMDVKHCLLRPGRLVPKWRKGAGVVTLNDLIDVVWPLQDEDADAAMTAADIAGARYLRVRYDGFAEAGEEIREGNADSERMFRVQTGDIVISHINAVHGAVAVVPEELDGAVVTSEFTVCRAKSPNDPRLVWSLLRSPETRADFLVTATGIGRTRVKTDQATQIKLPAVEARVARPLVEALRRAEQLEREARRLRQTAQSEFESTFALDNEKAREIIAAFKPPD